MLSAGYFAPRRRRVPANGLVSPVSVLPAGVRELYRDEAATGSLQQPDPEAARWTTDGSWSGHFGYLMFVAGRARCAAGR